MPKKIKVADLVDHFQLTIMSGETGLNRLIQVADLHRPGLEMAGYFTHFPQGRIQIIGKTELDFYDTLTAVERQDRAERMCTDETPCILICRGLHVPIEFIEQADIRGVPLLVSNLTTTIAASRITGFLDGRLAPSTTIHGVLVDVYGVGILLTGSSGIGKSETALELIKRGHRLVADDAVEIRQVAENVLIGNAPDLIKHLLEIRGIGIINVMTLFGAGAIRSEKKITVVASLETWQQDKEYDRLGLDDEMTRIIDTDLTLVTIPVRPGRNLAVIIEVAAMNFRLKRMGYNAALQFTTKLTQSMTDDLDDL